MANNYTPRRSSSGRETERRASSSRGSGYREGYSSRERSSSGRSASYNLDEFAPRSTRTTSARSSQSDYDQGYAPRRSSSSAQQRRPRESYGQDVYVRRSSPSRRRKKKSGPPVLPILLVILLVAAIVAIALAARGCSDGEGAPAGDGASQAGSAVSDAPAGDGQAADGASAAPTATPVPTPTPEPTPAPQEDPDAAPETVGGLMIVGDTAYEYYNFKEDTANAYITAVADAGEKLSGTATVYDMVIPTSIDIDLPETYLDRNQVNTSDQKQAIDEYILPSVNAMNPSVKTVSIFDTMKAHANEYVYFRTDHHWTQLGAYYGYVEFCNVRGFEPVPLDQFEKKEYTGYLGSFYDSSQSSALAANPDTVEAYIPQADVTLNATQADGTVLEDWPLIYDGDQYDTNMKYIIFCAGDQPYEEITNNDMADGPSCIVVKESFGNCFIPFLVNHYKTVYVVDYRDYQGSVTALAQEKGVDDVLCVNNISMTRNDDLVSQFAAIF